MLCFPTLVARKRPTTVASKKRIPGYVPAFVHAMSCPLGCWGIFRFQFPLAFFTFSNKLSFAFQSNISGQASKQCGQEDEEMWVSSYICARKGVSIGVFSGFYFYSRFLTNTLFLFRVISQREPPRTRSPASTAAQSIWSTRSG